MALPLFLQTILQKKSKLQTFVLAMELILLPPGLVSTLIMIKSSLVSHLPNNLVPALFKNLLSSQIYMIIFMNLMVVLIAASSYFDKLKKYFPFQKNSTPDGVGASLPDPFPLSSPPPPLPSAPSLPLPSAPSLPLPSAPSLLLPSAPPLDDTQIPVPESSISHRPFLNEENWKDIIVVAEASKINKMYSLQSSPDVDALSRTGSIINDYEEQTQIQVVEELFPEEDGGNDEDDDNSLAEMWRVIRGGRDEAGKPELKKSETFPIQNNNNGFLTAQSIESRGLMPTAAAAWKELRKTVTFDDTISMRKRAGLMRDCLMSQESLGKTCDAFINSIKNTIRIEREESIIRSRNIRKK